jgi:hypothetical protein
MDVIAHELREAPQRLSESVENTKAARVRGDEMGIASMRALASVPATNRHGFFKEVPPRVPITI